ncbi:ADP/ATP translocase 4-like isoform X2 [Frieseomelitta varia]|uniref:ADP/ATP translocase 4-like isoform X2 n=1 Tax=Frieseomelitta varia TaxID=561572 RepID=UPI001CB6B583|nr:ADP/ATP translocase 4-like isoform X2 [Frieseomelitta varia]
MLGPKTSCSHIVAPFLSGGAVGCTSCTILYPLHFCNTRITVDVGDNNIIKREFHGLNDCISKIYKSDGYRGFYRGMTLSMCGLSLYRSIYFGAYIVGKRGYMNNYATDPPTGSAPFLISLTIAQLASYLALIVSYPLDTISRQKMLWSGREAGNYVSARQVISTIIEKDGSVGFYRGVSANLISAVCGSLILVTYDIIKERFNQLMEPKNTKSEI